jgi:hypothetical protein
MMRCIDELCFLLKIYGRPCKLRAVFRLVKYWSIRTHLSLQDVCDFFREDVKNGWPIGLKKRGFV